MIELEPHLRNVKLVNGKNPTTEMIYGSGTPGWQVDNMD